MKLDDCDANDLLRSVQVARGCCGGLGFVRQHMTGSGTGFLAAGGTILQKVRLVSLLVYLIDKPCVSLYLSQSHVLS